MNIQPQFCRDPIPWFLICLVLHNEKRNVMSNILRQPTVVLTLQPTQHTTTGRHLHLHVLNNQRLSRDVFHRDRTPRFLLGLSLPDYLLLAFLIFYSTSTSSQKFSKAESAFGLRPKFSRREKEARFCGFRFCQTSQDVLFLFSLH